MGLYTKYRDELPRFQNDKPYQQKVDAAKRALLGLPGSQKPGRRAAQAANVAALARQFAKVKRAKKKLEDKIGDCNVELEALSQLLTDRLETEETQAVELRGGITVSLKDEPYPFVTDRRKIFAWIKKRKMLDLLTVHHQTLKGLVGDALKAGTPSAIPDGVELFIKVGAKCTGLKLNGAGGDE